MSQLKAYYQVQYIHTFDAAGKAIWEPIQVLIDVDRVAVHHETDLEQARRELYKQFTERDENVRLVRIIEEVIEER